MNNLIFSRNEILYLKDKEEVEKKYSNNYIYQIRHSIRKKVRNYLNHDDLNLFLNFKIKERRESYSGKSLIDDDLIEVLVLKILRIYPYIVLKILNLPEIKKYLGD